MNATSDHKMNSQGLTGLFIKQLAQSYLPAQRPMPADATPIELVHVAQKVQPAPKGFAEWLGTIFLMLWPRLSYRITGTLVCREEPPQCGVLIHITGYGYASRGGATARNWSSSWEEGVEQAAHSASALILPYTKKVLDKPWRKDRPLSSKLFGYYERANKLKTEHRYDEALDCYYEALDIDPKNTTIRLETALLQERLWLFADALTIYSNVLSLLGRPPYSEKGALNETIRWFLAMKRGPSDLFVASYRYVIILGFEEELADQWYAAQPSQTAPNTNAERTRVTKEWLCDRLAKEYGPCFMTRYPCTKDPKTFLRPTENCETTRKLAKLFFLHACYMEAMRLNQKLKWLWLAKRLSRGKIPLNAPAIKVLVPWALVQRKKLEEKLIGEGNLFCEEVQKDLQEEHKKAPSIQYLVTKSLIGKFRRQSTGWLENYNAACTYAMGFSDGEEKELIVEAFRHLRTATSEDSPFIRENREWLLTHDPDLRHLRNEPQFVEFEAQQFPSRSPIVERPENVHDLEVSRYKSALVAESADVMERRWHLRSKSLNRDVDVHKQREWWEEESKIWECLLDVCANSELWTSRVDLISAVNDCKHSRGVQLRVSYGCNMQVLVEDNDCKRHEGVESAFRQLEERIKMPEPEKSSVDPVEKQRRSEQQQIRSDLAKNWAEYFADIDCGKEDLPPGDSLLLRAAHQAGLWQGLKEWFSYSELDEESKSPGQCRFEGLIHGVELRRSKKQGKWFYVRG